MLKGVCKFLCCCCKVDFIFTIPNNKTERVMPVCILQELCSFSCNHASTFSLHFVIEKANVILDGMVVSKYVVNICTFFFFFVTLIFHCECELCECIGMSEKSFPS